MRLQNFILFISLLVIGDHVYFIINRVKEICNFLNGFRCEIIVAVEEKQILSFCALNSVVPCGGKPLIFFGENFYKVIFTAVFLTYLPTVVGRAVIYNEDLHKMLIYRLIHKRIKTNP